MDIHLPTDPVVNFFNTSWVGLVGVVTDYPIPIAIACAIAAGGITSFAVVRYLEGRRPTQDAVEEQRRRELKRRAELDQKYANKFGDMLFDMFVKGEINRHEYRRDCKRFGLQYQFTDLLVRKTRNKDIKHRVKHNVHDMHTSMSTVQPAIPGPKPGESIPLPPPLPQATKRKVWVAVGKAGLRLKSAKS